MNDVLMQTEISYLLHQSLQQTHCELICAFAHLSVQYAGLLPWPAVVTKCLNHLTYNDTNQQRNLITALPILGATWTQCPPTIEDFEDSPLVQGS